MHIELILDKSILIIPLENVALGVCNPLSYLSFSYLLSV